MVCEAVFMMMMVMMGWRAAISFAVIKVVELGIFALPFAIDCRKHREGWCSGIRGVVTVSCRDGSVV